MTDEQTLYRKVKKHYPSMTDNQVRNIAGRLHDVKDSRARAAIEAWAADEPIPEFADDEYSVNTIRQIRGEEDVLHALLLYCTYREDPREGEREIWHPRKD